MDTLGIEAFLAVVRHGSVTEAANCLFLSQSTLSHRLAELEKEVGMSLIDRGRGVRTLTLTEYGKEFLMIAKRWEDLVQDTKRIQSRTKQLTLSIGAVDTIHTFVLPPLYQALREHTQHMNLRIKTHNSTELYLQVDRGQLDVAFPIVDLPMENIITEKFYTEPRVLLRKEPGSNKRHEFVDEKSLDPAKEVFFEGDPAFQKWHEHWRGERGNPSICVDTPQLLLPLLSQEGNWSIVPLCIARQFASTGTFSYYRLKDQPPERVCYKIQPQYPRAGLVESLQILDACLSSFFIESLLSSIE